MDSKVAVDRENINPKSKLKVYLVYVLVVCFGLFIGNIIFGFLTHPKDLSIRVAKPSPIVNNPDITVHQEPSQGTPPKPTEVPSLETNAATSTEINIKEKPRVSLVLNGVFFSEDEGYALINNQIVKVGDVVDGATVKRIDLNEVELETAGSTIKLSTQTK